MKKLILVTLILFGLCSQFFAQTRAITQIAGDLYRFQNNAHFSVFLVTSEGIVVTDPVDKEAASWLNAELNKRFDVPVKYLIYSHDHADHITGGEAFGQNITVISHEITKEKIIALKREAPVPDITFSDHMSLELGGQKIELYYPGKSHGDNCIAMLFPSAKTVFIVDFITVNRLPYRNMGDAYLPDWIEAIKKVESLDFEILAPAHGALGTKADAVLHREYIQSLYEAVSAALKEGKSLKEMQASIRLPKYKDMLEYENWLPLNIEGVYKSLVRNR